ncbi:hypothetical protein DMUE_2848 [Dictyocoela muelleri]|nr:hypothetical protein DMUE_2848 [Dictyocoela muelleri]
MVSLIENQEEYENICKFLEGNGDSIIMSKYIKKRLEKKSEGFILIDNLLYLKNDEGVHKRVFQGGQREAMKIETTLFHKKTLYVNRFEDEFYQFYFKITRI